MYADIQRYATAHADSNRHQVANGKTVRPLITSSCLRRQAFGGDDARVAGAAG